MNKLSLSAAALLAGFVMGGTAGAQTGPTPQQIQGQIAAGQEQTALSELKPILRSNPNSGVAWYLVAEAEDAAGNEHAARDALATARQDAPGLPFAQPAEVAALQAHLNAPATAPAPAPVAMAPARAGLNPLVILIVAVIVLFVLARMFIRSRRMMRPGYPANYGSNQYGPNGMPYGTNMGGGMGMGGSGIGGSLLGGLAAGAGFAAGERVIDDMMGSNQAQAAEPMQDYTQIPDRDDGLSGAPDWGGDTGGGGGGDFDPNNSW